MEGELMTLEKLKSDPRWSDKNFRSCWFLVYSKIVPRYLYKFCQIDKHLIDNLKNNQLWFSSSLDFNDPFDCKINLIKDMTPEEIEELANTLVEEGNINKNDRYKIVEVLKSKSEKSRTLLNNRIKEQLKKLGICCFQKKKITFQCGRIMLTSIKVFALNSMF